MPAVEADAAPAPKAGPTASPPNETRTGRRATPAETAGGLAISGHATATATASHHPFRGGGQNALAERELPLPKTPSDENGFSLPIGVATVDGWRPDGPQSRPNVRGDRLAE